MPVAATGRRRIPPGPRTGWRQLASASFVWLLSLATADAATAWSEDMDAIAFTMSERGAPGDTVDPDDHDGGRWTDRGQNTREVIYDDGEAVDGDRLGPSGDSVQGAASLHHQSLLRPRVHFVRELTWMALDV